MDEGSSNPQGSSSVTVLRPVFRELHRGVIGPGEVVCYYKDFSILKGLRHKDPSKHCGQAPSLVKARQKGHIFESAPHSMGAGHSRHAVLHACPTHLNKQEPYRKPAAA